MFTKLTENFFVIEMSEWEMMGFLDPITNEQVYKWTNYLRPEFDARNAYDTDLVSWSGILPSGAKVTVYND